MFQNLIEKISGKPSIKTKDDIAKLLKTTPEALQKFEESYMAFTENEPEDDTNLFSTSAKDMIEANHAKTLPEHVDKQYIQNIICRITDELLTLYDNDGRFITDNRVNNFVTNQDIQKIPVEIRPQLAGTLHTQHINDKSYIMVLGMYAEFMQETDLKKKQHAYHMFRQGLDILDLDPIMYQILGMNRNSMGYWFPELKRSVAGQDFFKVPVTKIVKVPLPILQLTRMDYGWLTPSTLKIVDDWAMKAFDLDVTKSYFVKTGTYSSKFDFRNCKVTGEQEVCELGEYLLYIQNQAVMAAGPLSTPCIYGMSTTNEWVVREFIEDKENNPCIYHGLPLHTEYRAFVDFDTDEILGISPYWRKDVMLQRFGHEEDADSPHQIHDYIIYQMHADVLDKRYLENVDTVLNHLAEIVPKINLEGQWSMDIMQNGDDFWIIDMATADTSALNDCVPEGKLKKQAENWLPVIED